MGPAADNRLVEGQFFSAHLPQGENCFATDTMLLAAMDHARFGLQPRADVRGEAQCAISNGDDAASHSGGPDTNRSGGRDRRDGPTHGHVHVRGRL